tara:strand:- start:104 stop:1012 length:909 start_codon:yes stop_codon:yes gene_type:complete
MILPYNIQGFGTREITDQIIRAFVKSTGDSIMHEKHKIVNQYEQTEWPTFKKCDSPVALWGVLRGTEFIMDMAKKMKQDWFFFDHAYIMNDQKHHINQKLKERIYRCTKNAQMINYIDELSDDDYKRIEKYEEHIQLEPWRKGGKYILILEPSDFAKKWYNVPNWTEKIVKEIKGTKEIRIRQKNSMMSFESEVKHSSVVISLQSAAAIQALIWGIPSFCGKMSAAYPVSHSTNCLQWIKDPYYHDMREPWLHSLLANQYTWTEIVDGTCWNRLKNKKKPKGNKYATVDKIMVEGKPAALRL